VKRIFVTGAHGLLGSALLPALESSGFTALAAPRQSSGPDADLCRAENAERLLAAARPEVIVNLAALTDVDRCEAHPQEAYRLNAGLVLNLVRWIESRGPGVRLIQLSTDQVYDGAGPHIETNVCPVNVYGFSKCLAEEYARRVGGTSLRTNFFGPSGRPGRSSFSDWLITTARAGTPVTVFEDVSFSPLSLAAVARAIELVIRAPRPGTYNLGSRHGMSKADFAFALLGAAGLPTRTLTRGSVAASARAARRPHDMRMDTAAFERAFGVVNPALEDEIAQVAMGYRNEAT
jgi:dTDP-4-dehydrorhamnose reductase